MLSALRLEGTTQPSGRRYGDSSSTEAALRHPDIRFELLDAVTQPTKLAELGARSTVVAIDINGNRAMATVLTVVLQVEELIRPELIIIKCSELHAAATAALVRAGGCGANQGLIAMPDPVAWAETVRASRVDTGRCVVCERELVWRPRYSLCWASVRFCESPFTNFI